MSCQLNYIQYSTAQYSVRAYDRFVESYVISAFCILQLEWHCSITLAMTLRACVRQNEISII